MITFAHPHWLIAGLLAVVCYWFFNHLIENGKQTRLETFASSSLLKNLTPNISPVRKRLKITLQLLAIFCCFIALARPQYGSRWIDVKHKGIDILFALDTSKSMLAEDTRPNRLERSKLAIMDFVSQLQGDRVGLLPFAGSAYLVCPLTSDYQAFEQSLMAVDTTIIPVGGTNIGNALKSSAKILNNEANHKILVLITDGEDLEGQALKAAVEVKKQNVTVYTVGIGTGNGELIPSKETGGFLKDGNGEYVKSRLDEKSLKSIAELSGGIYLPLGNKGEGLQTIYEKKLALIPKTEFAERRKKVPLERFGWPLTAAIILLAMECLISVRKPDHAMPRVFSRISRIAYRSGKLVVPLFLIVSLSVPDTFASQGEKKFESGDYIEAARIYSDLLKKDPDNPQLLYNSGTTAYKNNLFKEAAKDFKKSLSSDSVALQKKAYYNLGNALYRQGEQTLTSNPETTISHWEQAVEAYLGAMALDNTNENARFNHDMVSKRLEQLKKQQEQQSENEKENENNQDQNGKNKQNSSGKNNESERQQSPAPEEKQTGEKQSKEQQQAGNSQGEQSKQEEQTAPSDKDSNSEQNQPVPAQEKSQENKDSDNTVAAAAEQEAATAESMTREEAEKLLQAIQGDEGRLNLYVPMQEQQNNSQKDW